MEEQEGNIRLKVSFSVDQKEGTPEDKKITVGPSVITSVNKTQAYDSLGVELTGEGFKIADLNTFKVNFEDPRIESITVERVSIISDKKIRARINIYQKAGQSGCLSIVILLILSGLSLNLFKYFS